MKAVLFLALSGLLASSLPSGAQSPSPLSQLVGEAMKNNPEILAAQHTWRAARYTRDQATALPNPQFTFQEFSVGSPRPFAGLSHSDFAYVGLGASQELPYPGKLRLKGQAAERAADVQQAEIAVTGASVVEQVKIAYLRLAYLKQTLDLLETSRTTLGQVVESELTRYRAGEGNQFSVLNAQLERTKLVREITMHHQEMGQIEADLKQLVHRPQESPDIVPEDLKLTSLTVTSRELLDLARKQNPAVRRETSVIAKEDAVLRSAERGIKPDFSLGYTYERTGLDFPAYYMVTFGLVLPRRQRVRGEVAEAGESLASAKERLDSQVQNQLAEVQKHYVAATTGSELLTEYNEGLIPQADAAFHAGLAAYGANKEQLDSVLRSFNSLLDLKRECAQVLLDHETAIARLETLTGVELR
jgi:outer membrane protein TolC